MNISYGDNEYQATQFPNLYASTEDSVPVPQTSRSTRNTRNRGSCCSWHTQLIQSYFPVLLSQQLAMHLNATFLRVHPSLERVK